MCKQISVTKAGWARVVFIQIQGPARTCALSSVLVGTGFSVLG